MTTAAVAVGLLNWSCSSILKLDRFALPPGSSGSPATSRRATLWKATWAVKAGTTMNAVDTLSLVEL